MKTFYKYSWIVALFLALAFVFVGCGKDPDPDPDEDEEGYVGKWTYEAYDDEEDNGESTCSVSVSEDDVVTVTGEIVKVPAWAYPFAGWEAIPDDDETLAKLRAATSISFTVKGENGTSGMFRIMFPTTDINDHSYFSSTFYVSSSSEESHKLTINSFRQPSWSEDVKGYTQVRRDLIESIQFQTPDSQPAGPFKLIVSDLRIH